jgi:flagellar biosynthesis protein FlhA
LVTSPLARRAVARLLKPHLPETPIMSFLEIPDGKAVEVMAIVGSNNGQAMAPTLPRAPEMAA